MENTQRVSALLESLSAPVAFSLVQGRIPDLDNLMDQLQARKDAFYLNHVALFDHQGLLLGETATISTPTPLTPDLIQKSVSAAHAVVNFDDKGKPYPTLYARPNRDTLGNHDCDLRYIKH